MSRIALLYNAMSIASPSSLFRSFRNRITYTPVYCVIAFIHSAD